MIPDEKPTEKPTRERTIMEYRPSARELVAILGGVFTDLLTAATEEGTGEFGVWSNEGQSSLSSKIGFPGE